MDRSHTELPASETSGLVIHGGHPCWASEDAGIGERRILFRCEFTVPAIYSSFRIRIFCGDRFAIWVNGVQAGSGAHRFVPGHELAYEIDLAPLLWTGPNCLAVASHVSGHGSYQVIPSEPWFCVEAVDAGAAVVSTPGSWVARPCDAVDASAPPFSFALGPVEIVDHRLLPKGWMRHGETQDGWQPVVPIDGRRRGFRGATQLDPGSVVRPSGMTQPAKPLLLEDVFGYCARSARMPSLPA